VEDRDLTRGGKGLKRGEEERAFERVIRNRVLDRGKSDPPAPGKTTYSWGHIRYITISSLLIKVRKLNLWGEGRKKITKYASQTRKSGERRTIFNCMRVEK